MIRKHVLTGVLVGLLATAITFYLSLEFIFKGTFLEAYEVVKQKKILGVMLSMSAIPNLFAFFLFIKQKQDYKARGVLLATLVIAFLILGAQFI